MPTKTRGLWKRFVGSLKLRKNVAGDGRDLPRVGGDGLLSRPPDMSDADDGDTSHERFGGPLARWSRRDQAISQLQEGYEKISQVIEEIRSHMAAQGERGDRMCHSLEQLARALNDHPEVSRQQAELLETIAGQLEASNERSEKLTEVIQDLPKLSREQQETLTGINRHLEMAGEQNVVASQTMEKVGSALNTLGQVNSAQADALKQMNSKATEQNEMLSQLLATQSRRFTMLFVVTLVLAAAAVVAVVAGLLINR